MASGMVPIRGKKSTGTKGTTAKNKKSELARVAESIEKKKSHGTKSALMKVAESIENGKAPTAESAAATSSLLLSSATSMPSSSVSADNVHPSEWTVDQVTEFLEQHGISEKIRDRFVEQVIDGYMLPNMDQSDGK